MFFRVLVKRPTRKGGEVVVDRVVEFDGNGYELNNIMVINYQGLLIDCVEIQKVDKVDNKKPDIKTQPATEKSIKTSSRLKLDVKLNDDEILIHAKASKALVDFKQAESDLNHTVAKRMNEKLSSFGWVTDVDCFRKNGNYEKPNITLVFNGGITEFKDLVESN